jgi:hypothetical protein
MVMKAAVRSIKASSLTISTACEVPGQACVNRNLPGRPLHVFAIFAMLKSSPFCPVLVETALTKATLFDQNLG